MDLRYKLKTAPVFAPVSLAELKRNLRIDHTDQDTLLQDLLDRAVAGSQVATGRQYARATYTLYLDEYPDNDEIEIDLGPVAVITSVKYYAQDASSLTTLETTKYQLDNIDLTARLRFLETFTPDTDRMNVIEIEFTNGWATAAEVPKELVEAIILRASEGYLHPENMSMNFGFGVRVAAAEIKERNYKVQRY